MPEVNEPAYRKGLIVRWSGRPREILQIVKIRRSEDGERWEYKLRYYNALFERGNWAPEGEIQPY